MILNLLKNFISFYGEHEKYQNLFFFFLFCQIVDNPVLLPFHLHKGIAAWEISFLKLLVLGCFLCKAEAGQGKECTDNEKPSQSPQDWRTGTSGTSLHSWRKNVKPCASVAKDLSERAAQGDKELHNLRESWPLCVCPHSSAWRSVTEHQQRMLNCNDGSELQGLKLKSTLPQSSQLRETSLQAFSLVCSFLRAPFHPTTHIHTHAQMYTHHTHAIPHTANTYTRTPTSLSFSPSLSHTHRHTTPHTPHTHT